MSARRVETWAGNEYGHVPGHTYVDALLVASATKSGAVCSIVVVWGSAQGYDEEHGRRSYAARGADMAEAIELARDRALAGEARVVGDRGDTREYIESASAQAIVRVCEVAS